MLAGAVAALIAAWQFSLLSIDASFMVFAAVMTALSSVLQIQVPRPKLQPAVSLTIIFLAYIEFGGSAAVMVAMLEGLFASMNLKVQDEGLNIRTVGVKTSIAVLAATGATQAVDAFLTPIGLFAEDNALLGLSSTVGSVAFAHLVVSAVILTAFAAVKDPKQVSSIMSRFIATGIPVYVLSAAFAGAVAFTVRQFEIIIVGLSGIALLLVFMTYKNHALELKESSSKVEEAERERAEAERLRAEEAERQVSDLRKVLVEQEESAASLKESREKFRHAAFHDALTDLPNRNLFIESLRFQLEKSRASQDFRFAVLFLDLDRFKMINDSLGHSLGDRLIWHVGRRLQKLASESDLVARFSGDEFAILVAGHNDPSDLLNFAQLVKHKLSAPFSLNGRQVFTGVSIGIATGNAAYTEAEEILRDADIAMYYAKEHETGVEVFDAAMHTKAVKLLQLETDLRHAPERNELVAYYQPIVDLATMRLMGFESLVRWNHPQRGLIPPLDFIPLAEESGMIVPLTMWMLRKSCSQLAEWQSRSPLNKGLMMSINLSGKHFADPKMVEDIRDILVETNVAPSSLKLEITESAVMENADAAIAVLKRLRDLGCQLSIDDFGTGYSSLSYLHRFPIDMLKVDRSFVSTMEDGSENGEIVRTIIALAKTLGLSVVAEGIESIHQLHQLRILGCEYGQGFLFARPVPSEEATALLDDRARWQSIIPDNNPAVVAQNREFSQLRIMKQ
jgi:diguanylate cyclase (GGDEF)-like protein